MSSTGPSLVRYRWRGPIARVLSAPRCETPHRMLGVSLAVPLSTDPGGPCFPRITSGLPARLAAPGSTTVPVTLRLPVRLRWPRYQRDTLALRLRPPARLLRMIHPASSGFPVPRRRPSSASALLLGRFAFRLAPASAGLCGPGPLRSR